MANYYPRAFQPTDSLLFDSDGNIVGIRSGSSKDAILYGMTPTQNTAFQAMVSGDGMCVLTDALLSETLLMGSDTTLWVPPKTKFQAGGTFQHTLFRTGNAEFKADAAPVPGVSIYCADEQSAGTGTLRYTHATTSLAWLAPGESSYGPEIDISGVTSASTVGIFIVPAAGAGKALYVYVAPATRSGVITRTVRVEAVTGAKACTWTRASNVRTVVEAAHGRRVGDFVINFGPSGDVSFGFIASVTVDSYTFQDAGSDQGAAQSGRAYGVRNIRIIGNGATINYSKATLSTALMSNLHAIVLHACSDVRASGLQVNNCTKYACLVTGYSDVVIEGLTTFRDDSAALTGNSDVVHFLGPGRNVRVVGVRAQAGDNIVSVGCADYYDYVLNPPSGGDLSLIGGRVVDTWAENTNQHPVRFYNANTAGVIRGWVIDTVRGTYSPNTDACVAIISDISANMVDGGSTNVDGLTVIAPDAVRSDGTMSYAFLNRGGGTRSNIKLRKVKPRPGTSTTRATVWCDNGASMDDIDVVFDGATFSGYLLGVTGTGSIGRATVRSTGKLVGDNSLGGGQRPALVAIDSSTATISYIDIGDTVIDDTSASGTKISGVYCAGAYSEISISNLRAIDGDALVRHAATAVPGGTVRMRGVNAVVDFPITCDGGAPAVIDLHGVWHNKGANAMVSINEATARTIRARAVACRGGNRFLRNVSGSHTWLISGHGNEPGSGASLVTDAGSPLWRLDGDWDLVTDGAMLDATVANHRPGAKFYNSNAAFGAPGVGLYARGSAAWVRLAS